MEEIVYILLFCAVITCVLFYKWSAGSDFAFLVSFAILSVCLYILYGYRHQHAPLHNKFVEGFEQGANTIKEKLVNVNRGIGSLPVIDTYAISSMWNIGDRVGGLIRPSFDYLIKAVKGDTVVVDEEQYDEYANGGGDNEGGDEDAPPEDNPLDRKLVKHLKERKGIDAKTSPDVVSTYQDLNLVLSLVKRMDPTGYKTLMALAS